MTYGDGLNPVADFIMEDMMIRNRKTILKREWSFFTNTRGQREYNKLCIQCKRECKQSFRVKVIQCKYDAKKDGELNGKRK